MVGSNLFDMAYFEETLIKSQLIGGTVRYTYQVRFYESEKDVLGVDLAFTNLDKGKFEKLKKLGKFTIIEARRRKRKAISRHYFRTVWQRTVKKSGNTVMAKFNKGRKHATNS